MPKSRRTVKKDGRILKIIVGTKFRIGTRKTGKSAHSMSTAELNEVLADSNKARYHNNARAVLAIRA